MFDLKDVLKGSSIKYGEQSFDVKGKAFYVTEKETEAVYAKILLNDHNVLVVSPDDNVAYIGKNFGQISEFDGFPQSVVFEGKKYDMVNHDYQIVDRIVFGNPLEVEGEVEFWDYENEDSIISVAITSRAKDRADVVAKYIGLDDISVE